MTAEESSTMVDSVQVTPSMLSMKVALVGDPTIVGVVTRELTGGENPKLEVFCGDGKTRTLYATQVVPVMPEPQRERVTVDRMKAALTATQLARPSASHLYSLSSSRIDFVPYQFRPVMKLIRSDRPRLLIADEVGVGKTIEAGLILKELQARREIESVLIICPKPLVTERKWFEEMKRFDETFVHLDGPMLRFCIEETRLDGKWPAQFARAIVPYSLLDEKLLMGGGKGRGKVKGLIDLEEPPKFDLIIVDEAHHIRNTDTWSHRNVQFLVDSAEAVVFLSATPIQTRESDLFNLLRLLRPDLISDRNDFERIGAPNPSLNLAAAAARRAGEDWHDVVRAHLREALSSEWGREVVAHDPRAWEVTDLLDEDSPTDGTRVKIIRLLEELHTFSGVITRTRRRDIGNFTVRKPRTARVDFTPAQQEVHDELLRLCRDILEARHGSGPVQFLISGLRRQAASSINGLAPVLKDLLARRVSTFDDFADEDEDPASVGSEIDGFEFAIENLIDSSSELGDDDPKYDALYRAVQERLGMPNPKVLLFTSYRHTIAYLYRRLSQSGIRVVQVNGTIDDSDRREARRRFTLPARDSQAFDVLLSTEVGTEGLDYQFCDMLINYDLPWNPMRIEQRIGRIDRRGQKSETVAIINLITDGTVDADIYDRCLMRIGVFEHALGASEAILGDITTGIRKIADDFTLTSAEQSQRLQQLADNDINLIEEQTKLEEEQAELFGIDVPLNDESVIRDATSGWLTPAAVAHLVVEYLTGIDQGKRLSLTADSVAILRLSRAMKDRLLADFNEMPHSTPSDRDWKAWLKGGEQTATVTVNTELASERPEVHLLSPTHPLVRSAAQALQLAGPVEVSASVSGTGLPPGRHKLAVHGWNRLGIRDDYQLRTLALDSDQAEVLVSALAGNLIVDGDETLSIDDLDALERTHYEEWDRARVLHQERSRARSQSQLTSLAASSKANIRLVEEQLTNARDERIRRMRSAQLSAAHADYERRRSQLESIANQSDIESELLVVGVIDVLS